MPEQFLEVSMQLVFENKCLSSNLRSAIVEVDKDYPLGSFLPPIKTILRKTPALKADVKTVSYRNGEIKPPPNSNTLLIIAPISDLDKCGNFLDNKSIFVLARGSNKEIPKINHGLVLVMEQQFDGEKLLLLRKAVPIRKNVPVILLTGDDWTWLAKIKTVLNNGIGDCSRVFVAVHTASLGDWRALVKQLSNEPKAEKLRYCSLFQ
uniref:Uncharacterized protein n=1 Tax=Timema douglasi TaxID=61478 RepID=A0A7R8W0X2_TIMDO|nr:unnamed protein product [Timema douglasi]